MIVDESVQTVRAQQERVRLAGIERTMAVHVHRTVCPDGAGDGVAPAGRSRFFHRELARPHGLRHE
jgi:hypothetical protein